MPVDQSTTHPAVSESDDVDTSVQAARELPSDPTELSDSQELYCLKRAQNDDGTVDVTAYDWERDGDTVDVQFVTATGDLESETMPWPNGSLDGSRFVRTLNAAGYGIVDAGNFGEKGQTLRADPDTWELSLPTTQPRRSRMLEALGSYSADGLAFVGKSIPLFVGYLVACVFYLDPAEPSVMDEETYESNRPAAAVALGGLLCCVVIPALAYFGYHALI